MTTIQKLEIALTARADFVRVHVFPHDLGSCLVLIQLQDQTARLLQHCWGRAVVEE